MPSNCAKIAVKMPISYTLKLMAVHAIGEDATEIIHIGHAVIAFGGTIEYFRDNVFNYPTFAEAYKVATYNGLNKIDESN